MKQIDKQTNKQGLLYLGVLLEGAPNCKGCGAKNHGASRCTKGKKAWRLGAGGTSNAGELVKVVEVASLANGNSLHQFTIRTFPCFLAPARPNTSVRFRLANASKPPLIKSPSPLIPTAWAVLLQTYPGGLRSHLPMIIWFWAELGYQGPLMPSYCPKI